MTVRENLETVLASAQRRLFGLLRPLAGRFAVEADALLARLTANLSAAGAALLTEDPRAARRLAATTRHNLGGRSGQVDDHDQCTGRIGEERVDIGQQQVCDHANEACNTRQ